MSIRRSSRTRTATVLVGVTAAALSVGVGSATAAQVASTDGASLAAEPSDDAPRLDDSLPDVSAGEWPAELTEHTRLFVNPYRSYLVQIRDGEPTLVLSTGFDSCWFMTQDGVVRYPC